METVAESEIVVVGGGIAGSSSAYNLAKAGKSVMLVEKGKIAGEASGRNGGGTRQQGRHPSWMPLAIEALKHWPHLDEELGYPTEWTPGGDLVVALNEVEMEVLRTAVVSQNRLGLSCHLVDVAEIRAMVKGISDRVVGGLFAPSDGHANPILSTKAFAKAAEDRGVKVWTETEVTGFEVRDGEVVAVDTSRGRILTKFLVLTAGPWTGLLGRMLGAVIPVYPARIQIFVTETTGPLFDCFLVGNGLYGRQAKAGNLHFGGGGAPREYGAARPFLFDKTTTGPTLQHIAHQLFELLPGAAELRVIRSWGGMSDSCIDRLPVVDRLKTLGNVVVAAGFSGHGFGLGPGTGRVVSDLVLRGETPVDISGLKLDRFDYATEDGAADWAAWYSTASGYFEGQRLVPPGTRTADRW